jgi:hypothetical protein
MSDLVESDPHLLFQDMPADPEVPGQSWLRKVQHVIGRVAVGAAITAGPIAGTAMGAGYAVTHDTNIELGGTPAAVHLTTHDYDELSINDNVLSIKLPNRRELAGQPIGVALNLDIDTSRFIGPDGQFDASLLPAYISLFSDTRQIGKDVHDALLRRGALGGGVGFGLSLGAYYLYRKYGQHHPEGLSDFQKHLVIGTAIVSAVSILPSSAHHDTSHTTLHPDAILVGTPLQGGEADGFLQPVVRYIADYVANYVSDTDIYYDKLQNKLADYLTKNPVAIPTGEDISTFGFVSDRHCNIGMDRVTMGLMNAYGIKTLILGGDDALNGSFNFEKACTSNLAERAKHLGIEVVGVGGNHDSPMTLQAESEQGIKILNSETATINGITFVGNSDQRASRYGTGMFPSNSDAQIKLTTSQGKEAAKIACDSDLKIVAILHDPNAGRTALENGCGNITLALDGHAHVQSGPTSIDLPNGTRGYQFTTASSGGAPGEEMASTASPLSELTVGPLNHPAGINIVSYNTKTGELVAITTFTFEPDMTITSLVQTTGSSTPTRTLHASSGALGFTLPDGQRVLATGP